MEPFELIRNNAAKLHTEVVAKGADPMKPATLIAAAVRYLDLELVWLPPEDPTLKGARAIHDEQAGTICCAITESEAERLLLVGHEIGHVRVHSTSAECSAADIDPSRSMEAAPVGLQRVEDYGAHERRELQANVFAREFLLPRTLARQLHVEEGLGASTIAERLGLPKDLVRQQLLDALLMPQQAPAQETARRGQQAAQRDESQERAAAHRGSAFMLQAGPGTGKTRTLVKRVSGLLEEGVDAASILILTFSNRAAGELSERIALVAPEQASRIWTGTFHAFGLDLLRRHHDLLDLPPDPSLFDRSDAIEVLEGLLPILSLVHYRNLWDPMLILREIVAAISRAKDEVVSPARYQELAEAMRAKAGDDNDAREAAEKCLEVARVYDLYEKALRERRAVDFGDLVMRSALLLEQNEPARVAAQLRHRHVLVDEYQDVNHASTRLLRAVAADGRRLWVVGDSRQSIYRFRGASSTNMSRFLQQFPDAVTDRLERNYRSSKEVINLFTTFSEKMDASTGMLPLALTADKGPGGVKPQIRRFTTPDDEAEGVAASVRELEIAGVPLRDQAVLCRSNGRLNEIAAALEIRGIPVLHLGSLFERSEIRDLLAPLTLAVDRFGDGLVRVATIPRYRMSLQDVAVATAHLRLGEGEAIGKLAETATNPSLSAEGAESIRRLAEDLAGLSPRNTPWEFLATWLLDRTRLVADFAQCTDLAERLRGVAIWQFLNFVREQGPAMSSPPIRRVLDRVRQLVLLAEERDLRQVPAGALHMDAVRLLTVHGAKGLEFDAVHVPGLTVASFPANARASQCPPPDGMIDGTDAASAAEEVKRSHAREEECLFFVATSRARTHLRITLSRKQRNGKNRSESQFLGRLRGLVEEIPDPSQLPLPAGAQRQHGIVVHWLPASSITERHLAAYQKCPRRFFYTHVLDLGGARKPTAFTRTHDCLYELVDWLVSARVAAKPTLADTQAEFERLWTAKGPTDDAYAEDYHRLATNLVAALMRLGEERTFRESEPLPIDLANGRVIVEPDEMAELADGTVVLRRVRTGHKRSTEYDRLEYTLYELAGRTHYGQDFQFEAVHLADELVEPVSITEAKFSARTTTSNELLSGLRAGEFPPEVDAVTCPRCPHFFICDATPAGPIKPT